MTKLFVSCLILVSLAAAVGAEEPEKKKKVEPGDKLVSGMSVVGNDEAPTSLVIVPWKSSELGDTLDISRSGADILNPIDREVFMRSLSYHQIRTGEGRAPSAVGK